MFSSISIEFCNDRIKILEGIKKGSTLSILKCLSLELPKNCIEDGKINNINIVKQLIHKSLIDNNIKAKNTTFIINSNLAISRKIELPYLKNNKDTQTMIHYNLEDMFSSNYKQYMFIYKITDIFIKTGVKYASYIIQGIPKTIYDQYVGLSKSLKIELKKLDSSPNCLENLSYNQLNINQKKYNSKTINAFVGIHKDNLSFSILRYGINEFFRIYYFNETEENIERVAEGYEEYLANYSNANTEYNQNSSVISVYTDVILKYIKYFYSINKGKEDISKIFIYGDKIYPEIEKELQSNLDMDVELVKDISNVTVGNTSLQKSFVVSEYLNCTLAQLNNNKSSNFLTERQKYHKLRFNLGLSIITALVIMILIFALNGINYLYKTSIIKNEIEVMKRFVEDVDNINQNIKIEENKQQIDKLKKYLENAALVSNKIKVEDCVKSKLLTEIKNSIPNDTNVNSISIDKNTIHLVCRSKDMQEISMLLNNLRNTGFIKNVYIPEVVVNNEGEDLSYSYQVLCSTRVD